ncbi:hypothetical protein BDK51DRAFT_11724, partial [Blyttiomyces helicus]
FDWEPWANQQAYCAGFFILTGGIIGCFYPNQIFGFVNIGLGLLIMGFEKPIPPFTLLGPLSSNFYFRSFFYFVAIAATMFQACTMTGGLCLFCAAVTYLRAAINGEEWKPPKKG